MRWIADTNLISETKKPTQSKAAMQWLDSISPADLFTTTVNLAEIRSGVASLNDQVRKLELSQWYSTVVMVMFAGRVLEADENSLVRWHALLRALQIDRKPNPPVDVLVAAIAREHECGVATRDTAPFVACGIPVLNPWTGERFNGA